MRVTLVAAVARNRVIGTETGLPWHLPRDLKRFRALTTGKPVVMGRTTFEHVGRPLPDRANIVLTRRSDYAPEGVRVAHTVEEALAVAREEAARLGADEVMVIGGGEVYRAIFPLADRLHLTVVGSEFEGTATFPVEPFLVLPWAVTAQESHPADTKNPYPVTFWQLDRAAEDAVPPSQLLASLGIA